MVNGNGSELESVVSSTVLDEYEVVHDVHCYEVQKDGYRCSFPALDLPANDTLAPAPHINIAEERTIKAVQGLGLTPSQSKPTALAIIDMNIIANIPPLAYR
jgi:hypothetical protein